MAGGPTALPGRRTRAGYRGSLFAPIFPGMAPYDISSAEPLARPAALTDGLGRRVTYLRLSVTDRCDLRCVYCMAEHMRFLPKAEVLSLEELDRLASIFIALGVRKLRLTGGEPLARKGLLTLLERLSRHLASGALDELAVTTNGTRLGEFAAPMADMGVRRVNVSLDTLDPALFARLTRGGDLAKVLAGIEQARAAGLEIKLNTVALANDNRAELPSLITWAHARGLAITLIEAMPMGEIEADRADQFVSLKEVRRELESFWTLRDLSLSTGGPARYVEVAETGGRLGFIAPLTGNFCDGCNRVRLTCTGVLHACLGREAAIDLRSILRADGDGEALAAAIRAGLSAKPHGHDFHIRRGAAPAVDRHMSTTGG